MIAEEKAMEIANSLIDQLADKGFDGSLSKPVEGVILVKVGAQFVTEVSYWDHYVGVPATREQALRAAEKWGLPPFEQLYWDWFNRIDVDF